jgi:hypothetical protein
MVHGSRPPSTYECALGAYAATERLKDISPRLLTVARAPSLLPADSDEARRAVILAAEDRKRLAIYREDFPLIKQLTHRFSKELIAMGVSMNEDQRTLNLIEGRLATLARSRIVKPGEALTQFSDVPTTHWAAQATANLRREGILTGYPDNTFKSR